jgi:ATP-dependent Lhr-like helicase
MEGFTSATSRWFAEAFDGPTPVQREGWRRIAAGEHCLLVAPTGSGKTLAAFLFCLDQLSRLPADAPTGTRVVYVSPLKALVYDIERNLRAPLAGIERSAALQGRSLRRPSVALRTGDTTARERRAQARYPADVLVTTPESLYLILGSAAAANLASVDTIIVDEVHALAPNKRGAHLALSLERLARLTPVDPQRIGLSATVRPAELAASFLGGDRAVSVVDSSRVPAMELSVVCPVADMTSPEGPVGPVASPPQASPSSLLGQLSSPVETRVDPPRGMWAAIVPQLVKLVDEHQSTIIFVNSRGLCERLCQQLNDCAAHQGLSDREISRAHHGSLAHDQRREIEEALKAGQLPAIVATSSLELGIDMGAVDLVVLVESPGSVARGLQRIGRAGHHVGAISHGRLYPKHQSDLLESAVVARLMRQGELEPLALPRLPLDVLAQQIVASVAVAPATVEELLAWLRRTASFTELSREMLATVLDMLSGKYPSTDFADLRPRLIWDRATDRLTARKGSKTLSLVAGGTIPDRGLYAVTLAGGGSRLGELDEEMVHETRPGEVITLGASSWRVERVNRDRVEVSPAPGEVGKLPFWHGEGPGRPVELGRAVGAMTARLGQMESEAAEGWLQKDYDLDRWAARNLVRYVRDQREATGCLPTDRAITIERFRDDLGDYRLCLLTPFGTRVHAPWALAIETRLAGLAGFEVQALWTDDGIVLRLVGEGELPTEELLLPEPEQVEDLVVEQLGHSPVFAAQFRENAARALLMPRPRPGQRTPLWAQRLKAQQLLGAARNFPSFPIVLETYRSCLQDLFDVPALREILEGIRRRDIRVDVVDTREASPFARSLVFAYVSSYMYAYAADGDLPLAERRAHALALDRRLLEELLGHEGLRELLDSSIIEQTVAELQRRASGFRARDSEELHDLFLQLGDVTTEEVAQRCAGPAEAWLEELRSQRRVVSMRIGGEPRWIAVEDVALYRDALGAVPPQGVAAAFLEPRKEPLDELFRRWVRRQGPFETDRLTQRYHLVPAQVEVVLSALAGRGEVLRGDFMPGGRQPEWIHPEVLQRLRRRTLAKMRGEVAPVEGAVLGRFLPRWQGVDRPQGGAAGGLEQTLAQLEGLPLSFAELESALLPCRVPNYQPRQLDELGAVGAVVWVGSGSLGARDGKVALYRRERASALVPEPQAEALEEPLCRTLVEHLQRHGASFLTELLLCRGSATEDELLDALWQLVWAGWLTNDTFHPLRHLRRRRGASPRRGGVAAGGRWSLVSSLREPTRSVTEQAHSRTLMLLERYGLVCRAVAEQENLSGGFAGIYDVLRAMEEAGKVRRGHFIEGLAGAQFAYVGAVDQLRGQRPRPDQPAVTLLAATDPANPYGGILPWPEPAGPDGAVKLRRVAGSSVVLLDGELVLYLDRQGRRAWTFVGPSEGASLVLAAAALGRLARRRRGKYLRLESIDGVPARSAGQAAWFKEAGFVEDYKGLVLEV